MQVNRQTANISVDARALGAGPRAEACATRCNPRKSRLEVLLTSCTIHHRCPSACKYTC